jgi:hypothetical protein
MRPARHGVRSARRAARAGLADRFALVLHAVPDAESALYVPLRSNAMSLVTGAPIAALRRRLKYGRLFHDTLILEAGILRMKAGAGAHALRSPSRASAAWRCVRAAEQ